MNIDEGSMQHHVLVESCKCIGCNILYRLLGNHAYVVLLPTSLP